MFDDLIRSERMVWLHDHGVGYVHPSQPIDYGKDYFDEYQRRKASDVNDRLMAARCNLVAAHHNGWMIDVGCGAGAFIEAREARRGVGEPIGVTYGFDVNPHSVHWLIERNLFRDPMRSYAPALSLFDVFEHIDDPRKLIAKTDRVFLSIPIFRDAEHAVGSKHFKPGEHVYYYSDGGIVRFFANNGFQLVEKNRMEEEIGREDVGTYVFVRAGS